MTPPDPTPGSRLNDFLAALPASAERTQALVDLNAILHEANDALRAALATPPLPVWRTNDTP